MRLLHARRPHRSFNGITQRWPSGLPHRSLLPALAILHMQYRSTNSAYRSGCLNDGSINPALRSPHRTICLTRNSRELCLNRRMLPVRHHTKGTARIRTSNASQYPPCGISITHVGLGLPVSATGTPQCYRSTSFMTSDLTAPTCYAESLGVDEFAIRAKPLKHQAVAVPRPHKSRSDRMARPGEITRLAGLWRDVCVVLSNDVHPSRLRSGMQANVSRSASLSLL